MTQNNKPEWFEITDADEKPELRKVSKSLPVSAVMVAALILGAGVVVAQTQNEAPASAVSAASGPSALVESNPTSQPGSAVKSAIASPTTAAVAGVVATNTLVNPAIAQLPTGGGDDDDDDDYKRGHDDDDEDDEGDDD